MARKSQNIFNECLERILRGESIESCLRSYPREAAELEPLLRAALGFKWRASSVQPRPEFKARARLRLEGAQLDTRQQGQPYKPGFFAWQRGWAFALTAALVILLTGAGTVAASSNALPDESLYPVKLATEETRLAFTFSDAGKAELHTQLAEDRALEIAVMARQGRTEQAAAVTENLAQHLDKANQAIQKVEETEVEASRFAAAPEEPAPAPEPTVAPEPDTAQDGKAERLRQSLGESTSRSLVALENAMEQAPEQAKPALRRAIDTISEKSHKKPKPVPSAEDEDKDKGKGNHEHKDKGKGNHEHKDKGKGNGDKDEDKPDDQDKGKGNNKGNDEDKGNGEDDDDDEEGED